MFNDYKNLGSTASTGYKHFVNIIDTQRVSLNCPSSAEGKRLGLPAVIDPRWSPTRVIQKIGRAHPLITEALHGAIVSDTLGVP